MDATEKATWVRMTESHAAAVWIAHARLNASALRNLSGEDDDEGDADWADVLDRLYVAWQDGTPDFAVTGERDRDRLTAATLANRLWQAERLLMTVIQPGTSHAQDEETGRLINDFLANGGNHHD